MSLVEKLDLKGCVIMNDLKFAIDMELDGEKYYRQQAEMNKNSSLRSVCLMLAEDEKMHAKILTGKMNEKPWEFIDTGTLSRAKNIFEGIGDIKIEEKELVSQFDFYRIATEKEKKSIDLYTEYKSKAYEDKEKELFDFLIKQEEQHYAVLDELSAMLRRTQDWVENAEFGIRKEY